MAETRSIYEFPDIYDVVMRRPMEVIEGEVAAIERLLGDRGITGGRVLELGCGTCAHGILLAQHGFEVTGLDLSQPALDGARQRADAAGVELELIRSDWTSFGLEGEPFDCVIFPSETFPLITKREDVQTHFATVRRHLRRGGLYVIDFAAARHGVGTTHEIFGQCTKQLEDGFVEVWGESLPGDWVQCTNHMIQHFRIHQGGQVTETADEWRIREDTPWYLRVLVETLPDWSLVGFFSWRDLSADISDQETYAMVLE